jgi:hypothetical protein
MIRYARIPAVAAMVVTAAIVLAVFAATGQFRRADVMHISLAELEKHVVGSKDARVWLAYGDRLREQGQFDRAAQTYQKAVELQGDLMEARLGQGLTLGQAAGGKGKADEFFAYVGRLSGMYPKVAVQLLERPELRPLHADERWEPAVAAAKAQAVD